MTSLTNFDLSTYALDAFQNTVIAMPDPSSSSDNYGMEVYLFEDQALNEYREAYFQSGKPEADFMYNAHYTSYTIALSCSLSMVNGLDLYSEGTDGYGCCLISTADSQKGHCVIV